MNESDGAKDKPKRYTVFYLFGGGKFESGEEFCSIENLNLHPNAFRVDLFERGKDGHPDKLIDSFMK